MDTGKVQLQLINIAADKIEHICLQIKNHDVTDIYGLISPDEDDGLKIAIGPYENIFRNGALPWGKVENDMAEEAINELKSQWANLFSAIAERLSDKACLKEAREAHNKVHEIFCDISFAPPGTMTGTADKKAFDVFRDTLVALSDELCSNLSRNGRPAIVTVDSLTSQAAAQLINAFNNSKKRKPRSKSSLRGPKTKVMERQLNVFSAFLASRRYDGNESRLPALAIQCWNENRKRWDKYKSAKGSQKGYSCPKVLADAYRNMK